MHFFWSLLQICLLIWSSAVIAPSSISQPCRMVGIASRQIVRPCQIVEHRVRFCQMFVHHVLMVNQTPFGWYGLSGSPLIVDSSPICKSACSKAITLSVWLSWNKKRLSRVALPVISADERFPTNFLPYQSLKTLFPHLRDHQPQSPSMRTFSTRAGSTL